MQRLEHQDAVKVTRKFGAALKATVYDKVVYIHIYKVNAKSDVES